MDSKLLIESAAIPTGAAAVVAALLMWITRRRPDAGLAVRLGVLIAPMAYLTGHLNRFPSPDWSNWQAVDAWQWLAPGVAVMALAGIVGAVWNRVWLRLALRTLVIAGFAAISLQSFIRYTWTPTEAMSWIAGIAIGGTVWWQLVETAGRSGKTQWFALQWLIVAVGSGAIFLLSQSARLLEMTMMLGAGIGVSLVLQAIGRRQLAAGLYGVAPFVMLGLWLNGYFYADMAWWRVVAPAIAPLAGTVAGMCVGARRRSWLNGMVGAIACAAVMAGAVIAAKLTETPNPYGGGY
mgnify:CR=1 FL=1